ncbi:hypothetical protein V5799_027977 [Amblyomma americanum]|uniref:Uncharacterized protein n=1 Tax=Amblyomma americanum TaxID=6943 RepID=A0AAQ4DE66_AMBAM
MQRERRLRGPTATPEDGAVFVDPVRFVAGQEPDVVTVGYNESTSVAAATQWPEPEMGVQIDGNSTITEPEQSA